MAEIIWGIDMNNSSSNYAPVKRPCRQTGEMCEFAGEFGYCQITACIKYNWNKDLDSRCRSHHHPG